MSEGGVAQWETHWDDDSQKAYYYNAVCVRGMPPPATPPPSTTTLLDALQRLFDDGAFTACRSPSHPLERE